MDPTLYRFRDKFIEEASNLLDKIEKDLLELEKTPNDKELIESVFRAMHTIKGVSGMYAFDFICEYTHHMESMYQAIRDTKLSFNKEVSEITFLSVDHIRKLLSDEKLENKENKNNHNKLMASLSAILDEKLQQTRTETNFAPQSNAEITENTWHIILRTNEMIHFRGINLLSIFNELSTLGEFKISRIESLSNSENDFWDIFLVSNASEDDIKEVFMFVEGDFTVHNLSSGNLFTLVEEYRKKMLNEKFEQSILNFTEASNTNIEPEEIVVQKDVENNAKIEIQAAKRISVDSLKLDNLMYLVSELITVNSQLILSTREQNFDSIRPFVEKVDNLSKLFRTNAIEIRLVPLSDTVLRFQRLIRDLSNHLHKSIEFKTQGTDTELDKNTIDQLAEPLMHIIRNSLDHGIETPENRVKSGKPETGIIKLSSYYSGSHVFITIEDDGNGIDLEKVRLKAVDKGILKVTDKPSKKEIFDLIFLPGFSTAQNLTEVSGRGVGMDVVKKKINSLRGEVIVESEKGIGTKFILKLQQSLAIIDTLLFKVENTFFTVPISEIEICTQLPSSEIDRQRQTSTLPFNDNLIHFIDLRQLFNLDGTYGKKVKVVIIRNNQEHLALITDSIVGGHQAVLKPMGKYLNNQKFLTSTSQLGDGNLAFMIDTNELYREVNQSSRKIIATKL